MFITFNLMIKVVSTKFFRRSKVANNAFATFDLLTNSFDLMNFRRLNYYLNFPAPANWQNNLITYLIKLLISCFDLLKFNFLNPTPNSCWNLNFLNFVKMMLCFEISVYCFQTQIYHYYLYFSKIIFTCVGLSVFPCHSAMSAWKTIV